MGADKVKKTSDYDHQYCARNHNFPESLGRAGHGLGRAVAAFIKQAHWAGDGPQKKADQAESKG
jgi:hypothetical protein